MSNEYTKGILTMSLPALNFPWKDLEELGTKMEFCRGTTIPCEKVRDYFYFLKKGRMSILYTASDRKVQTMVQMKSGTLFNVAHALCAKSTCFLDCCSQFYCTSDVTAFRYHYSLLYDEDFIRFMLERGIVVRHTRNFAGLDGKFVRIAARTKDEDDLLIEAAREYANARGGARRAFAF